MTRNTLNIDPMTTMWSCFVCIIASLFVSCEKENNQPETWEKIEVNYEGEITGFYGDLEHLLLVSNGIYIVGIDNESKVRVTGSVQSTITSIKNINDTLFALSIGEDYYSVDEGVSWKPLHYNRNADNPVSILVSSNNVWYKLQQQFSGESYQPSLVLTSTDKGETWSNAFPYNYYITAIYLDSRDRLHAGAKAWEWNNEEKTFDTSKAGNVVWVKR